MDVRFLTADGVTAHTPSDLPTLLEHADGLVWSISPTGMRKRPACYRVSSISTRRLFTMH